MKVIRAIVRSLKINLTDWLHQRFGRTCAIHGRWYRSELCPSCVRQRVVDDDTFDRRPPWTKAGGKWPLTKPEEP